MVGDFNHDNNLDIAFVPFNRDSSVVMALGDGKGHFTPPVAVFSTNLLSAFNLVVGDFDGDGNADLAFAY